MYRRQHNMHKKESTMISRITALVVLMLMVGGCASEDILSRLHIENKKIDGFTKHFAESHFRITENKHFGVELLMPDEKLTAPEDWMYLVIHDSADRDVADADLSVVARNPETGTTRQAGIRDEGGGLYRVTGLRLSKGAGWEVTVKIMHQEKSDSVIFPASRN